MRTPATPTRTSLIPIRPASSRQRWRRSTRPRSKRSSRNIRARRSSNGTALSDPGGIALAALDQTQIETVVAKHPSEAELERYGLSRPEVIALMYARDSSSPLVRLAIGNVSGDGFSRYARLSGGDVVTIAAYTATNLVQLLKAVGAAS